MLGGSGGDPRKNTALVLEQMNDRVLREEEFLAREPGSLADFWRPARGAVFSYIDNRGVTQGEISKQRHAQFSSVMVAEACHLQHKASGRHLDQSFDRRERIAQVVQNVQAEDMIELLVQRIDFEIEKRELDIQPQAVGQKSGLADILGIHVDSQDPSCPSLCRLETEETEIAPDIQN